MDWDHRFLGQIAGSQYRLDEKLGSGAFGTVFRATRIPDGSQVAVKIFKDGVDSRLIQEEVAWLARLRHTAIIPLFGCCVHAGLNAIIMMHANHGSLEQRIAGGLIPIPEVVRYVYQVALGMHEAHIKGVLHRDTKPSNILLHRYRPVDPPSALLSDFGIAVVAHHVRDGTFTTQAATGSAPYMAPEQFLGRAVIQSDIYALGVTLFELLTGEQPYRPPNSRGTKLSFGEYHLMHKDHPVPTLSSCTRRESVSLAPFEAIINFSMQKDPRDRYDSAAGFADDLDRAFRGRAVSPRVIGHRPSSYNQALKVAKSSLLDSLDLESAISQLERRWRQRGAYGRRGTIVQDFGLMAAEGVPALLGLTSLTPRQIAAFANMGVGRIAYEKRIIEAMVSRRLQIGDLSPDELIAAARSRSLGADATQRVTIIDELVYDNERFDDLLRRGQESGLVRPDLRKELKQANPGLLMCIPAALIAAVPTIAGTTSVFAFGLFVLLSAAVGYGALFLIKRT